MTTHNTTGETMPNEIMPNEITPDETFTFRKCAQKVLEKFSADKPMHYQDITQKALDQGWLDTTGQTPAASMNAVITTTIKKLEELGEPPLFESHGGGFFSLHLPHESTELTLEGRALEEHALDKTAEENNAKAQEDLHKQMREQVHQRLLEISPYAFEQLVADLLGTMGFEKVELTPKNNDGGVDVRGVLVVGEIIQIKMAVQVKRYKGNIHTPIVQKFRGSLGIHEQGLIITTGDFSKGAQGEATVPNKSPIALMNGEKLTALLIEKKLHTYYIDGLKHHFSDS